MPCNSPYTEVVIDGATGQTACIGPNGNVWTPNGDVPYADYVISNNQGGGSSSNSSGGGGGGLFDWLKNQDIGNIATGVGDLISGIKGNKTPGTTIVNQPSQQTTPKSGNPIMWIVGGIVGLVLLIGVVVLTKKKPK